MVRSHVLSSILLLLVLQSVAVAAPPRVFREAIHPHWSEDGCRFWYRVDQPDGAADFVLVDAERGLREAAFDRAAVAGALSDRLGRDVTADALPIKALDFVDDDPDALLLLGGEGAWRLARSTGRLGAVEDAAVEIGIPAERTPRASRYRGGDTHVTFINRLDETVNLVWIDGSGGRQPYAELAPGQQRRQHTYVGHVWLVLGVDGRIVAVFEAPSDESIALIDGRDPIDRPVETEASAPAASAVSPDGSRAVFVRDHDLWMRDTATGDERPLSFDGAPGDSYRRDDQRPRLVEMEYDFPAPADSVPDVAWSPDSRHVIAKRTRRVAEREVVMVASSPPDRLQPRLETYPYLKPGDALPIGRPQLFDCERGVHVPLDDALFAEPWDIGDYHWSPDGEVCYALYNRRGHQVMRVLAIEAATGEVRAVVDETCDTFFDYSNKTYLRHLDESDRLIWMSERDGWNHLYLYDRKRCRVKKRITKGDWVVRGVDRVDEEAGRVWLRACGIVPGQDPYFVHHLRVDLDGKNLTVLTEGDGTHRVSWSPDRRWFIDTWSRVDLPPRHVLRDGETGRLVCELEIADASEILSTGRRFPEPFTAPGRDGRTPIHGIIHRPTDFDPARSYPVLEYIYAGPHGQHVPKAFRAAHRLQPLADRGFIIVQIDGMGTNWRSKAFHDLCWRNLLDAGFPDRIAWMRAAAERYPSLDLDRVGIYGGSAGGQNALAALLTHGDFYRAAVSDCGCHDNRVDKIWWNEQWMGWPIGPHYAEQSNVTLAHRLEGDLLLIVGELDRNVDPASTMQVVDALVKADRDFEMLVLPGVGHGAAGTAYGRRRTADFFERCLLEAR